MDVCSCGCTPDDNCEACIFVQPEKDNPQTATREDIMSLREKRVIEVLLRIERMTPEQQKEAADFMRKKAEG